MGETQALLGVHAAPDVPADSPEAHLPLHGTNQWPSADQAPGFKPVMQAYHRAMASLSLRCVAQLPLFSQRSSAVETLRCDACCKCCRVLPLIAEALHLPHGYFVERFTNPLMTLRPIHYTAEESRPDQGVLGAGAHTDWGFFTYLVTDTTPGLQIWFKGLSGCCMRSSTRMGDCCLGLRRACTAAQSGLQPSKRPTCPAPSTSAVGCVMRG